MNLTDRIVEVIIEPSFLAGGDRLMQYPLCTDETLDLYLRSLERDLPQVQQRNAIQEALRDFLGETQLTFSSTGRPLMSVKEGDLSYSHKPNELFIGFVPGGYKLGVDIEALRPLSETFEKYLFSTRSERNQFFQWLDENSISSNKGCLMLWSLKESFFKCIDRDFCPLQLKPVYQNGGIKFEFEGECEGLKDFHFTAWLADEFVYSVTFAQKSCG